MIAWVTIPFVKFYGNLQRTGRETCMTA